MLLVIDGLDRSTGLEALRLVARLLRAVDLEAEASPWRLLLTCQTALWERCRQDMMALNVPLAAAKIIPVQPLKKSQVEQIAQEVRDIAPALLRDDLLPVMGRPKVLDLVACAAADVGLPDVTQWVGESSLVEWAWNKFFCGGERDARHSGLLQSLATRQADERAFVIPIVDVASPDRALLDDLARIGIIVRRRDETIKFAHDLYADYARQRFLLAHVSARRLDELKSRLTNPLWHRAIRLVSLHLLEYHGEERVIDIDGWRRLVRSVDERVGAVAITPDDDSTRESELPGAGVDLLLEGIAFAAQPGALLDTIIEDLVASRGALLRGFLFRFRQAAIQWVPLRDLLERSSDNVNPETEKGLNQIVHLPDYRLWSLVIDWMASHAKQVIFLATWEFLDAAEYWLETTRALFNDRLFQLPNAQVLARLIVDLAESMVAAGNHYSRHSEPAKQHVRLYRMMLLCGLCEDERVHTIIRKLAGLDGDATPKRRFPRSSVLPPDYVFRVEKPAFWPKGPKSEPSEQFREAALTLPGAERMVDMDAAFASEVFLALLIEVPDPDRDDHMTHDREGFAFDAWHYTRPPFWDFPPAHCLLSKRPSIGIDFIIQLVDFATDRWAEHLRTGAIFHQVPAEAPRLTLTIDGTVREFVGDARTLEWHQGGSQGPDAAAAPLMSLEHWLYVQDEEKKLDGAVLTDIMRKSHSVAVIGVLFDLALKNPVHLLGPLEPFVASPELYLSGQRRAIQVDPQCAMIAWMGEPRDRVKDAYEWHSMEHRRREFLRVVIWLLVQRKFEWPILQEAGRAWAVGENLDPELRRWVHDVLLPNLDKDNWHATVQPDGGRALEYAHPEDIDRRQSEERRTIEEGAARRYFPLRCRRILDGEEVVDEDKVVDILRFAAELKEVTEEETWLMSGSWTPRCAAAAVGILKFDHWLKANPEWRARCEAWIVEACSTAPRELRCEPSVNSVAWDSFCAETLPLLWARAPEDKIYRRALAYLVAAPHSDARRRLFATLARKRMGYVDDFRRLLHLSVWTARLTMLDPGPMPENMGLVIKVEESFLHLAEDFVNARLTPLPQDWVKTLFDERPKDLDLNPYGERDGFDDTVVIQSFAWLAEEAPGYHNAQDRALLSALIEGLADMVPVRLMHSYDEEEERYSRSRPGSEPVHVTRRETATARPSDDKASPRGMIARIQGKAMDVFATLRGKSRAVSPALPPPPRHRRAVGSPYRTDYNVAELVSLFLVREPDAAKRRKLWGPWLELGEPGHYWVDLMLDNIYIAAGGVKEQGSSFSPLMKGIFEHALAPGGWLDGRTRQGYRTSDVGRAFLGFGDLAHGDFWSAERAPSAIALCEYWPRWVDVAMTWLWCARAFIRMLRKPAFAPLRPTCLHWLVRSPPADWISEGETPLALVRLLELVWQERHEEGHELTRPVRDVFERLLRELVARHQPDAVQLSAQVGRNE